MSSDTATAALLTAVVHTAGVASSPGIPTCTLGCASLLSIPSGEQQRMHQSLGINVKHFPHVL